jgi:hypothetical protein
VEFSEILQNFLTSVGPVAWMGIALTLIVWLRRWAGAGGRFAGACLGVFLAVQLGLFLLPQTEHYRANLRHFDEDARFVARFLRERRGESAPVPTVFWPIGQIDTLWIDLRVKSYYDRFQVQGVMFSRDTALEGRRRALLVRHFEGERLHAQRGLLSDRWLELLEEFYGVPFEQARPTRADLERLCREEPVDYVVIRQGFDGLYAVGNGRFFIYDCKQVRAALAAFTFRAHVPRNVNLPPGLSRDPAP